MNHRFYYSDYWMEPWRRTLDLPEIMRRLAHRVQAVLVSAELDRCTETVAIWPSLVVDTQLPRGVHSVTRGRKPPAWRVLVVIPFQELMAADALTALQMMIAAWKLALDVCFSKVKLSSEESRRLINEVTRIVDDPGELLDVE